MNLSDLITPMIFFLAGCYIYYELEDLMPRIYLLVGLFGILAFCMGIDVTNRTPESNDNLNVLNGITLLVCAFFLEKNIVLFIKKIKVHLKSRKEC